MKTLLLICTAVLTISLSSCLSLERNIIINTDGSGSETLEMKMDKTFMQMLASFASIMDSTRKQQILDSLYDDNNFINSVKKKYSNAEGVRIIDVQSVPGPDSSKVVTVAYTFDNVSSLKDPMSQKPTDNSGTKEIQFTDKGEMANFTYVMTNANGSDTSRQSLNSGLSALFVGDKLIFNIEFPYDVISSNATQSNGRKLRWEYNMTEIMDMKEPLILSAEMKK